MKKILIFSVLVLGFSLNEAQFRNNDRADRLEWIDHKKYNWGFFLNVNNFDYKLVLDPQNGMNKRVNMVESKPSYGFGAG